MKIKNKTLKNLNNCINHIFNNRKENYNLIYFIDILLLSQNLNSKDINTLLLSKLSSFLFDVNILSNTSQIKLKSSVSFQSHYLTIKEKIGSGSYGNIFSCNFDGERSVIKNLKLRNDEFSDKSFLNDVNNEFLKENIIHLLLFCMFDIINDCSYERKIPKCIPDIKNIFNGISQNGLNTYIIVMERLDYDLYTFFSKKHSFEDEMTAICLIAYNLYILQRTFKEFMHRDLHCGNIMVKKLDEPKVYDLVIGKDKYQIKTLYDFFIIDFGMCSVDFNSSCNKINMPDSKIYVEGSYNDNKTYNKSQDLRLFLASLYYWRREYLSDELIDILRRLFKRYEKKVKMKEYLRDSKPTFYFYDDSLKVDDKSFYPEFFLKIFIIINIYGELL